MASDLHALGNVLSGIAGTLDDLRRARDSLAFCVEVYERYQTGITPPNQDMDLARATIQLVDSAKRLLAI